jgi:hypothetical protein
MKYYILNEEHLTRFYTAPWDKMNDAHNNLFSIIQKIHIFPGNAKHQIHRNC